MKSVKKYTTFVELKSFENKVSDSALSLKRHSDFEAIVKHIRDSKTSKGNQILPKG